MNLAQKFRRQFGQNPWKIFLAEGIVGFIIVLVAVSTMSWMFHGQVGLDYIITGVVTFLLVAPLLLLPFGLGLYQAETDVSVDSSHLSALFRSIPDLVWVKDMDGVYLHCNEAFEHFFGHSQSEIIGRTDYDFVDAELADFFRQQDLKAAANDGPTMNEEWLTLKKNGYHGLFETIKTPVRNIKGELIGVLGVSRDISMRKNTEKQLEKTVSLLHATLESTNDAVLVVDLNGVWVMYNQNFVRLWGIPETILNSRDDAAALSYVLEKLEAADSFLAKVKSLYRTPDASSFDLFKFKDGKIIERYSMPQRIGNNVVGRVWSFRDVTERELALHALTRESEKNLTLLRNASDGIHIVDLDGNIIEASDSFCRMLGYSRDEVIGMNVSQWDAKFTDAESRNLQLRKQLDATSRSEFETLHRRKDGSVFDVEVSGNAIELSGRKVLFNSSRDITVRKNAEHVLQDNEARLREIIEGSPVAMGLVANDGKINFYNQAFTAAIGYDLQDMPDIATWWIIAYPDADYRQQLFDRWQAMMADVMSGNKPFARIEADIRCKDGVTRTFIVHGSILKGSQEGSLLASFHDITERKLAERSLARSEERLQLALNAAKQGWFEANLQTGEVEVSEEYVRMIGFDPATFHSSLEEWQSRLHPDDRDAVMQAFQDCLKTGGPRTMEYRRQIASGEWKWVSSVGEVVERDAAGRPLRMVGVHTDISERITAEHDLQDLNASMTATLQAIPDLMFELDRKGTYVKIWARDPELLFDQEAALLGRNVHEVLPPEAASTLMSALNEAEKHGYSHGQVIQLQLPGGEFSFELSTAVKKTADESDLHFMVMSRDITERKHAEDVLRETTKNLKEAQHIARLGVWKIDLNSGELEWSEEVYRMAGLAQDVSVTLEDFVGLVHPEDKEAFLAAWNHAVSTAPSVYEIQHRILVHDEVRWVHERASLNLDEHGKLSVVIGTAQDITEQVTHQEKLRESEFFLRQSQSIAQMGGWRADLINNRLMWTEGIYSIVEMPYDYKPDLETGLDFYPPGSRERVVQNLQATMNSGEPFSIQTELRTRSGKEKWVELRGFPHYTSDGRVDYAMGTLQDITLWKKSQVEKETLQAQLQQAQKMEAIGQLTGGIAHDFNNILAAILGYTGLALERYAPDKQGKLAEYLIEVKKAGERARDLIAKMLAFSRSHTSAHPEPIEMQAVVNEVVVMLAPAIPSSIQLKTDIVEKTAPVLMDVVDLHQVLTNLIINARDAVGTEGSITVAVRNAGNVTGKCESCHDGFAGDYVELEVRDSGGGIEPGTLHRIFDPFFTTKDVGKGSGMGLAVVHGIVHRYGGHILLDSRPGDGTSFRLLFPVAAGKVTPAVAESDVQPRHSAQNAARVMVVDDEVMLAEMLGEVLEAGGFQPSVFLDSRQALSAFRADPSSFDVVITDQTMPGLTGDMLVQELHKLRDDIPIILCTGYSNRIDRQLAADIGIDRFFSKPVQSDVLLKAVSELTEENNKRKSAS